MEIGSLDNPIVYHVNPDDSLLQSGAELVREVSLKTGFPDPARWPGETLVAHTRQRQTIAYQSVVATYSQESRIFAVGHSLLLPARRESWEDIAAVAPFLNSGKLAELGGTAVLPVFQRMGIAKEMLSIRRREAQKRGLILCVAVWDGGHSHQMYRGRQEWTYLGSSLAIYTQRMVHRFIDTSAL